MPGRIQSDRAVATSEFTLPKLTRIIAIRKLHYLMAKKERQAEFVKWMQPILVALRQLGGSGSPKEVSDLIAMNEKVSDKKLEEVMKSGGSKFQNQVAWARQYLVWEGLLSSSKKGTWA